MFRKIALLASAALCASALAAVPANAANSTYYIDCSAASNGNGSQATPWNNLATVNAATFGAGDQAGSVEQVVTITPNTTYVLSGWGKVSNADTQVVIGVKNYGGTETRAPAFTTTAYAFGSVTFTTGATNTTAKIYCYARVGTGYGYCDNITLATA